MHYYVLGYEGEVVSYLIWSANDAIPLEGPFSIKVARLLTGDFACLIIENMGCWLRFICCDLHSDFKLLRAANLFLLT